MNEKEIKEKLKNLVEKARMAADERESAYMKAVEKTKQVYPGKCGELEKRIRSLCEGIEGLKIESIPMIVKIALVAEKPEGEVTINEVVVSQEKRDVRFTPLGTDFVGMIGKMGIKMSVVEDYPIKELWLVRDHNKADEYGWCYRINDFVKFISDEDLLHIFERALFKG